MGQFFSGFVADTWSTFKRVDVVLLLAALALIPAYWSVFISRSTAKRQLRAYVSIGMLNQGLLKDSISGKWVIWYYFENGGATPAYNLTISGNHVLCDNEDMPLSPAPKSWALGVLGPRDQIFDYQVTALTDEQVDTLRTGHRVLIFYGHIRYRDAFKSRRYTNFRLFTGGSEPFKGPVDSDLVLHGEGNDAN